MNRSPRLLFHTVYLDKNDHVTAILSDCDRPESLTEFVDEEGKLPLHMGCTFGYIDVVKTLLLFDADVNKKGTTFASNSPLHEAGGRLDLIKVLLDHGADMYITSNPRQYTILHLFCCQGNYEAVKFLLDLGFDPNIAAHDGETPLHSVFQVAESPYRKYDARLVQCLVDSGADIHANCMGTPIYCARRRPDIAMIMMQKWIQTDPSFINSRNEGLLHYAALLGMNDLVESELAKGSDPNARNIQGITPLCWAVENKAASTVELLLKAGADPNIPTTYDMTPLLQACQNKDGQLIELLLDNGADVNAINSSNQNALEWLCWSKADKETDQLIRLLIERGLDIHKPVSQGFANSLDVACTYCLKGTVRLLIQLGADLDAGGTSNQTPLKRIAGWDPADTNDIVEMLLKGGANPNIRDESDGRTALHDTAERGLVSRLAILIQHGGDITVKDNNGQTPLQPAGGNNTFALGFFGLGAQHT